MKTMETFASDAAVKYFMGKDEEEREGCYELELDHLPPLLEDEENVSLADILSLRDSCLSEDEVWAVCAECAVALQSIGPSHLFHTLCITPDTLAFNALGNVCFMEQLSDDPEGSFVPPEFDNTGSTFEGHVYSLGSTLSAALDFVIEPELQAELGEEARRLLDQMQEENPGDRPLLQDILALVEAKLSHTSSAAVCRKLSSIGRRVLSIESVSTFQDGPGDSWEARWQHPKTRCPFSRPGSVDSSHDPGATDTVAAAANGLSRWQGCGAWDPSVLLAECMDGNDGDAVEVLMEGFDSWSQNSSPVRRRAQQQRSGRVRGVLNRSCSVPDSNNPPSVSPTPHGDISVPVSDLSEIGAEEQHLGSGSPWTRRLRRLERGLSCESCPIADRRLNSMASGRASPANEGGAETPCGLTRTQAGGSEGEDPDGTRDSPPSCDDPELTSDGDRGSLNHSLCSLNNHMTKSMLCLNEETQDEWISLRELLTRCGRRLAVNELWALCHTCLSTLQTYIDFPAYLCLDTVYVGCEGEVLFLKPKNIGSCDAFYLAPEYQEHGIVTEKACVYSVAAILWAAAKFSLSADQKLAMPRKLKRLLLEMAKRTPIERPSIVMAKKCCRDFLSRQGTDAETAWTKLIDRVHQTLSDSADREIYSAPAVDPTYPTPAEDSTHSNSGFVPMASESRLAPVHGPVPHSYPTWEEHGLPEAFTSRATHFTPIILTQEETPKPGATIDRTVHEFTRSNGSQRTQEKDLDCNSYCDDPSLRRTVTQRAAIFSAGADSSEGTPLDPLPSRPNVSRHGPTVSPPRTSSAHLSDYTVFDKYLLCRDPVAGHLTLVPVRVTAPESVAGWRLDLPPNPNRIQEQDVHPDANEDLPIKFTAVFSNLERQESGPSPAGPRGRPLTHNTRSESAALGPPHVKSAPLPQMSPDLSPAIHPALQEVIDLLKGEFDDGCSLKSGQEDPAMGEYIFSLKDLQYQPFSSLVKKKFGDLYWEEDLVAALHGLVNYSPFPLGSNEQPPLTALKGAPGISPVRVAVWRVRSEGSRRHLRGCLDLNGNIHIANPVSRDTPERSGAQPSLEETPASNRNLEGGSEDNLNLICRDADSAGEVMATGVTEGADHSMGGSDESPSDVDSPWGRGAAGSRRHEQMSPGCSEDMDDSESVDSGRRLSPGSKAEEPDLGSGGSPAWAMAFYGEERFSTEVVSYALTLGQHMMSPRLDAKTQELQQQLIIEKRNLKKTRKFYQKLLHQEQKSKGSDTKPMLSKLKTQLEEVISKVEFLDSVKKYLEVLSVDQWGLEVSLLPSLAACGLESLALRHHPDPSAVLSFGTSRGKSALQAGSPLGLMAYLYAQNAALEGYIQQFLYTYRYFCTNEEFLQFLMDTFTSAARSPDISGNSVKILFRTLDLLQAWLTDYKLVASTPKCILLATLENFLVTEVIPVDSRGETLLSVLHRSPAKSWSRGGGGPGGVEQDDSLSVHSPTGDHGRKTFQWRISRVVEPSAFSPKEEAFCIAAMLPMPCYSSLVGNLSSVSLRGEESPPFSQSDYSAQHAAQQLTLLQQEIFQGCHPVHFLNSRTQGVRDTLWSPNMNVSQQVAPAEDGGSLQKLLAHADNVSNWIAAEIVTCASVKAQAALLTKFLQIGKYCYESRNFGTAMQVLRGLENVIVRQLPAWKHLSSKVCENLEELRAVQVFLKSDDLCLMGGEQVRRRPTLPCVHILAMHVQQLEVGGFTLTTGAYRWTKLRRIAKVVSQVHAFQEAPYPYGPDRELQAYLRHRVDHLAACDIHLVAADSDANFQPSTARHGRRIQDTLQRVKATFQ